VIPAQRRLKPEDGEFKASLGYIVRLKLKKEGKKEKTKQNKTKYLRSPLLIFSLGTLLTYILLEQ
jgi:hypothetical protein